MSIIIPTYNRKNEIKECIEEIYKQEYSSDRYEVIIVDDGSTDNTKDALEQLKKRLQNFKYYIRSNEGPGNARNYGATKADGKILVFIDSDCRMMPGFLNIIEGFFIEHDDVAACSGDAISIFKNKLFLPLSEYYKKEKEEKNITYTLDKLSPFFKLRTDCCAVKKDVFFALGGFSDKFSKSLGEDLELGYRMMNSGYKVGFLSRLLVSHHQRANLKDILIRSYRFGMHDTIHFKNYFNKAFVIEFSSFPFLKSIYLPDSFFGFYLNISFLKIILFLALLMFISLPVGLIAFAVFLIGLYVKTGSFNLLWRFLLYKTLSGLAYFIGNVHGSIKNRIIFI